MTSYRGIETISCVGMQLVVEPDLGLCDNLKPNRYLRTERKRILGPCNCKVLYFLRKDLQWIFYRKPPKHGKN